MEIFKYTNPTHITQFDQGEIVNGLKTKMWIERYRDISDFEFVANVDSLAHLYLPIGTFVSHVDSTEIMIVENHEITDNKDSGTPSEIKITGRSFESFFENRIVGSNKDWPTLSSAQDDYILLEDFTWQQAIYLLKDHIDVTTLIDPDDAILHCQVISDIVGTVEAQVERIIARGDLYVRLLELLAVDNLGIKVIKPGVRSPLGFSSTDFAVLIHRGIDLSSEIAFSYTTGEIENADYLWSNKKLKNAALVTGKWLETVIKAPFSGYERRMMLVEANDIDESYSVPPVGIDEEDVLAAMEVRGLAALYAQNDIALVKAEPTKNSSVYKYREHYDVGDIVTVDGEYNENAAMRISEYVEIEDETGERGYPTLSVITEGV